MSMRQIFGGIIFSVGLFLAGCYGYRLVDPNVEDQMRLAEQADDDGIAALINDPRKLLLVSGIAALAIGGRMIRK
jgi:hypothetical protein